MLDIRPSFRYHVFMAIFFTADLHLSHRLVSGLRGFWGFDQDGVKTPDTARHDEVLAEAWDSVVSASDTVWILGDLSINSGPHVAEWLNARPGTKHLVSGNHDKTHTTIFSRGKVDRQMSLWSPVFESIQDETTITINGNEVILSHFPSWEWGDGVRAKQEGYVSRYEAQRPKLSDTSILLHGHTHGTETSHGREFHVGLDAHNLQLVPETVVIDWISTLD